MKHPLFRLVGPSVIVLAIGAGLAYPVRGDLYKWLELDSNLRLEPTELQRNGESLLALAKNSGELELWGTFLLEGTQPGLQSLRVWIDGQPPLPLSMRPQAAALNRVSLEVRPLVTPASLVPAVTAGPQQQASSQYFTWPSGDALVFAQKGPPIVLRDWQIWTKNAVSIDTQQKAVTRKWLDRFFVALWLASFGWLTIKGKQDLGGETSVRAPRGPTDPSHRALYPLIMSINAGDPKATTRVQTFLINVLIERIGPEQSLKAMKLKPKQARDTRVEAVELLDDRLAKLQPDVTRWRTILEQCKA